MFILFLKIDLFYKFYRCQVPVNCHFLQMAEVNLNFSDIYGVDINAE